MVELVKLLRRKQIVDLWSKINILPVVLDTSVKKRRQTQERMQHHKHKDATENVNSVVHEKAKAHKYPFVENSMLQIAQS